MRDTLYEYHVINNVEAHQVFDTEPSAEMNAEEEKACPFGDELQILQEHPLGYVCTRHTKEHKVELAILIPQNKGRIIIGQHTLLQISELSEERYKVTEVTVGIPVEETARPWFVPEMPKACDFSFKSGFRC